MARGIGPGGQRRGSWGRGSRWRWDRGGASGSEEALSRGLLRLSAGIRGEAGGGLRNLPHLATPMLPKPPEAPPPTCLGFPSVMCGHPLACLSGGNGAICQSCLETEALGTPAEWLLLIQIGERARFRLPRALSG